jgi:hypothetical protein
LVLSPGISVFAIAFSLFVVLNIRQETQEPVQLHSASQAIQAGLMEKHRKTNQPHETRPTS